MYFLVISSKDIMQYIKVFDYLQERGYKYDHSNNITNIPDVVFDFYLIEENFVDDAALLLNAPYLIITNSIELKNEAYNNINFQGYIDLNANPLSIYSYLHLLRQNNPKLEHTLLDLEKLVKQKTDSLSSAQALTLESLATLSEYRDNETGAHIKRTKLYVKLMLEKIKFRLSLTEDEIFQIWSSAPLHDIGKVAIPDSILLKQGKLTVHEFEIMKEHVRYGNEALMRVSEGKDDDSYLKYAKEITLFHHEKWNGSGYPYGLCGEDIPISARLMALADVYDALRSVRPYKVAIDHEKVVEMISEESGKHFDPKLVDVFIKYNEEFNKLFLDSYENYFDFMEY